jgi:HK97 family phage major capsid protein
MNTNLASLKSEALAMKRALRANSTNDVLAALTEALSLRTSRELLAAELSADRASEQSRRTVYRGETRAVIGDFVRALPSEGKDLQAAIQRASTEGNEELTRALSVSVAAGGGFAVPEDLRQEFIELLRPLSVVRAFGGPVIPAPHGSVDLSRVTSGGSVVYGPENTVTITQPTLGMLRLTNKKTATYVVCSGTLWRSSGGRASAIIQGDLVSATRTAEDVAFLYGNGTASSPRGVRNWAKPANLFPSTGSNIPQIDADLASLEYALTGANVPMSNAGWVMNTRTETYLKGLRTTDGEPRAFPEMNFGLLKGRPYRATNNVPINGSNQAEIILADWDQVVIADYPLIIDVGKAASYLDANSNFVSAFSQDQVVVRVISESDIGLRHDEAVAVLTGVSY